MKRAQKVAKILDEIKKNPEYAEYFEGYYEGFEAKKADRHLKYMATICVDELLDAITLVKVNKKALPALRAFYLAQPVY